MAIKELGAEISNSTRFLVPFRGLNHTWLTRRTHISDLKFAQLKPKNDTRPSFCETNAELGLDVELEDRL